MSPKPTHGGKRQNSGRRKVEEKAVTRSVSMPPKVWERLDALRGKSSRGKWIESKVNQHKSRALLDEKETEL